MFCSATCSKNSCSDITFNKCTGCPTGLAKETNAVATKCVAPVYNNLQTTPKYIPIGKTDDVNYDLKSTTTVQTLITNPSTTQTCSNGPA